MKKPLGEHARIAQDPETSNQRLECHHCGTVQGLTFPVSMTMFATILKQFAAEHRHCPKPAHIEFTSEADAVCYHCGHTIHAVQGGRLDVPGVVARHLYCLAPAPAPKAPETKCPICSRVLDLSSRVSGDIISCSCGVNLTVRFVEDGARLFWHDVFGGNRKPTPRRVRERKRR